MDSSQLTYSMSDANQSNINQSSFAGPSPLISEMERKEKMEKLQDHNKKLIELKQQLKNAKSDKEVSNIKGQIYQDLNSLSTQINQTKNFNNFLVEENITLKEKIKQADAKLSEYDYILRELKERFQKVEKESEHLKERLKLVKKKNKEDLKNNSNMFLSSLKDIQNQVKVLEADYKIQLKDKTDEIEKLKQQVNYASNENFELNARLAELAGSRENDEIKHQIKCILKERQILLEEKEKEDQKLKELEQYTQNEEFIRNKEERENKINSYLKQMEEDYLAEIANLQKTLAEKELLEETNKGKFYDTVSQLQEENQRLEREYNRYVKENERREENKRYNRNNTSNSNGKRSRNSSYEIRYNKPEKDMNENKVYNYRPIQQNEICNCGNCICNPPNDGNCFCDNNYIHS